MLHVVAMFSVPNKQTDTFLKLAEELVAETVKEAGCISYELVQDMQSKNTFMMLEKWENKETLDIHSNSAHFQRIIPQISQLVDQEITVKVCHKIF
ncbi:putative quinol monooxygenase [Mangrovibacterium lignilyticum]|uniref:putative quinol monooxygenase n=1 Tax=Mangrovibacterium lignilyticum TaxID=2668052 RepID=UPI0013D48A7A|nr:putative quinol monooxygenase [Mangrovibacterium lignilyticum]